MTAAAHQPNPETPRDIVPDIVLVLLGHDDAREPSLARLQHFIFLIDREHARSFGVVLTLLPWIRAKSGPRSEALQPVLHELDHAGQLPVGLLHPREGQRTIAESRERYQTDSTIRFSPRAVRSLQRVLWQYGPADDEHILDEIESTRSFGETAIGDRIDLSQERAWLVEEVKARGTDRRQWGDPEASAAEDEEIMEFFDRWRMSARRGPQKR